MDSSSSRTKSSDQTLSAWSQSPSSTSAFASMTSQFSPRTAAYFSRATAAFQSSSSVQRRTCMCSPTTHPGSFRCAMHKNNGAEKSGGDCGVAQQAASFTSRSLSCRRSTMTNSLVKRALAALIKPSSHRQPRRVGFQPRPSRLKMMSNAEDHPNSFQVVFSM